MVWIRLPEDINWVWVWAWMRGEAGINRETRDPKEAAVKEERDLWTESVRIAVVRWCWQLSASGAASTGIGPHHVT